MLHKSRKADSMIQIFVIIADVITLELCVIFGSRPVISHYDTKCLATYPLIGHCLLLNVVWTKQESLIKEIFYF